jgi:hypothetical protein
MKINRTQDAGSVPDWAVKGSHIEAIEKNNKLLQAGVERINVTASNNVDALCLFDECEYIEKCASSGESYYFNSTWDDKHLSHLKEYASVCGLGASKMIGVDPSSVVQKQASSEQMVKTASTEVNPLENALKDALGDPFHIEERTNMDHMAKANWEKVEGSSNLLDNPREAMHGGILPLRGGEDTRIANTQTLAPNQNSIHDANAIQRYNESEVEDTGARLARERVEREAARANKHSEWEQDKIAAMEADGFKAQGVVFPTEVMNAGSGISSSFMGAYSEADLKNLPDLTAGEQLSLSNEDRKRSIQRESSTEAQEWDRVKKAPSVRVSDHFTEELKKKLS